MSDEDAFLARIAATPADDITRLVYADWLEERDDEVSAAKAEFLRQTCTLLRGLPAEQRGAIEGSLQKLAETLDTGWTAVVSKLRLVNCRMEIVIGTPARTGRELFSRVCPMGWEEMSPTDKPTVRYCENCQEQIHFCDTITEARRHAWRGHCIAVDIGVIRRRGDLHEPGGYSPFLDSEEFRRLTEALEPDPVSAARERKKAERARGEGREAE